MFGIWRTLLAIEVVAFHLLFIPFIGAYAVVSFFVLSGFLMTAIVHGTYGYSAEGLCRYLTNRALRLYPSYWLACAVTVALIAILGTDAVARYHPAMTLPVTPGAWVENLTMIFPDIVPRDVLPRLVPLAWALTVEIVFYILIGLGLSRTKKTTLIWLAASLAYVAFATTLNHPRDAASEIIPVYQYSAIPAGSLPFAVGALIWHMRGGIHNRLTTIRIGDPRSLIAIRWVLYMTVASLNAQWGWTPLVMIGNWLNVGLSGLIVCALFHTAPGNWLRTVDKAVGDFSYPIYLLHLQMGLVATIWLFGGPVSGRSMKSLAVFVVGLALTLVASAFIARVVDPAVEHLRRRIKHLPASNPAAP